MSPRAKYVHGHETVDGLLSGRSSRHAAAGAVLCHRVCGAAARFPAASADRWPRRRRAIAARTRAREGPLRRGRRQQGPGGDSLPPSSSGPLTRERQHHGSAGGCACRAYIGLVDGQRPSSKGAFRLSCILWVLIGALSVHGLLTDDDLGLDVGAPAFVSGQALMQDEAGPARAVLPSSTGARSVTRADVQVQVTPHPREYDNDYLGEPCLAPALSISLLLVLLASRRGHESSTTLGSTGYLRERTPPAVGAFRAAPPRLSQLCILRT